MTFELQPTLSGERIDVRPLRPDDFDALFAAAADPRIWELHPEPDRWTERKFQKYFDGAIECGGAFAVVDRRTRCIIGSSRYWNLTPDGREVEIGWTFLERTYWGGAYNGELKTLMITHALQFVERIVFVVGENNMRSRRALEKIGARLDERLTVHRPPDYTRVVYVITTWPPAGKPGATSSSTSRRE